MKQTTSKQKEAAAAYARKWRARHRDKINARERQQINLVTGLKEWPQEFLQRKADKQRARLAGDVEYRQQKNQYGIQRRKSNPEVGRKYRLSGCHQRAKRKGWEFSITEADITWNTVCPILGIPLNYTNSAQLDDSPSVDRIDNSKGYIPGNVIVISWKANNLKSNGELPDFKKLVAWMESNVNR
jgi:hypothetical protein